MIELGHYTIGRGMANKQIHYKILGFNRKEGMEIWVQDYKNTGIILLSMDVPPIMITKGQFCVFPALRKRADVLSLLNRCRDVLKNKYKSLNFIINGDKLKDLFLVEAI